ncbi:MAG: glycosyltransferase family 2 protein [Gammaproteobacteria bacterium]
MSDATKPRVTIGIPTYNRASGFLRDALASAINQTYKEIEIIVSDNCSTDDTEFYVKGIHDPRVRYIKPERNVGPNGNFNFCLDAATGNYFLLLCDDDVIDADFVESCMDAAQHSVKYGIIRTGTRIIDENGSVLREKYNLVSGPEKEDFYRSWFSGETVLYLCSTLFNTQALRSIGGLKSRHNLFEDGYAVVKLLDSCERLDIQDVKASFRRSPNQRTYSVPVRQWCEEFTGLFDLIYKQCTHQQNSLADAGQRFFTRLSLNRARSIDSTVRRMFAYAVVAQYFSFKYWKRA